MRRRRGRGRGPGLKGGRPQHGPTLEVVVRRYCKAKHWGEGRGAIGVWVESTGGGEGWGLQGRV